MAKEIQFMITSSVMKDLTIGDPLKFEGKPVGKIVDLDIRTGIVKCELDDVIYDELTRKNTRKVSFEIEESKNGRNLWR